MAKTPEIDLRDNYARNHIINSNFDIWQRATSLSIGPANQAFVADRWKVVGPGSAAVVTASRSTNVPTLAESGFFSSFAHEINVTTIDAAATNFYLSYRLEGYDLQLIHRKTVTLSFWINATRTGTSCVTFNNSADDRGYPAEFTINNANTWEKKEITLTLDQAGTWLLDNGQGLNIRFILNTAVAQQGTVNTWQNGAIYGTANQVNHLNAVNNKYRVAQVMLTEGKESLSFRTYASSFSEEFAACQRYYEVVSGTRWRTTIASGSAEFQHVMNVSKRVTPTIVNATGASITYVAESPQSVRVSITTNATNGSFDADAEL